MGTITHDAIIVTDYGYGNTIERARRKAVSIFNAADNRDILGNGSLRTCVGMISNSAMNNHRSFCIYPMKVKKGG